MTSENTNPPPVAPNWLVCSSCSAPILTADELLSDEAIVLKEAVYAYELDMLDREIKVYSATNTADHRFDVVRAKLNGSVLVPVTTRVVRDERESLRLFLRHFQIIAVNSDANAPAQSPEQLLQDLDRLAESNDTSQPEEDQSPVSEDPSEPTEPETSKRRRLTKEVVCGRIETSFTEPTDEYTWFPSYSWTCASCAACSEHIGWVFWKQANGEWKQVFVGLIVTRLREKFIP